MPLPRSDYRYPVGYQQDAVARILSQLARYRGALLIASTGLGKTVIATEAARLLRRGGAIDRVLIIAPNAVRPEWAAHLEAARLPFESANHAALDASPDRSAGTRALLTALDALQSRTLLVIDECHLLRNRGRRSTGGRDDRSDFGSRDDRNDVGDREREAFARLVPAIARSGCRVLLMTATPFSRGLANLNAQLALLPRTAPSRALLPEWVPDARAWHVGAEADIAHLPVITVLTTPSVARAYGEHDAGGTFVRFGLKRRYFPRLHLHRANTPVVAGPAIAAALDAGVFTLDGSPAGIERTVRLSLTSSPWALAECVAKTLATPGPGGFARARFAQSMEERAVALAGIVDDLRRHEPADDPKLARLLALLDTRCAGGGKAVVFVERLASAGYLAAAIAALRPGLRVGCTVVGTGASMAPSEVRAAMPGLPPMPSRFRQRPIGEVRELVARFAPVANGVRSAGDGDLDVLLTTDAWGIGVNLQDAATVISYDLAWTPIELTQRAGRILRLWSEPRTVEIHAFVPQLGAPTMDAPFRKLWAVARRWETLVARHDMAMRLGEMPTLAVDDMVGEIELARLQERTQEGWPTNGRR
ncbi:MAG: DEAD/DEAH box helicase family protein [Ardenticatenales bacterium]|nr:DEAD/DEAH box helicase family protein [Ardenticatenales bacterium]